jgi:hypothetical protein
MTRSTVRRLAEDPKMQAVFSGSIKEQLQRNFIEIVPKEAPMTTEVFIVLLITMLKENLPLHLYTSYIQSSLKLYSAGKWISMF